MYETFFGLKRRPFLAVPDTESYFSTDQMEESSRSIERTVRRGEGIALLIGASGTGKTLLLRLLRETLETDYTVLLISNGHLETPKAFFQQLLYDMRLPFSGGDETELRLQLLDFARREQGWGSQGRNDHVSLGSGIVVLIDEAQFLSPSVLEEIRILMDCDNGSTPFFRVILAGNIELEEKLTHPQLESFNQRVVVRSYLEPLSGEETRRYITWQTSSAFGKFSDVPNPALGLVEFIENSGTSGEGRRIDSPHLRAAESIFTENAKRQIFQLTEGLPRLINQLCDIALQLAAERVLRQVDEVLIHSAWARLQQITEDESAESVSVSFPTPSAADIDEIIARKKGTFQPKEFNSTIEFGTLDDSEPLGKNEPVNEMIVEEANEPEPVSIRFRSPNEYKPPYPEDDEQIELESAEEPEEKLFEETITKIEPEPIEENAAQTESEQLEEIAAEIEPEPLDFYENLDTEILFSSIDTPPLRQLPLREELNEAIEDVAEAIFEAGEFVAETSLETVKIAAMTEQITESVEEPVVEFFEKVDENTAVRCQRIFYPCRHRRIDRNFAQNYRLRKVALPSRQIGNDPFRSCIRQTSFSMTRRCFVFNEGWIANISFRPVFIPSRLAMPFIPEPLIEDEIESEALIEKESIAEIEYVEIINEATPKEAANEISCENSSEDSDMDLETLEKYAEAILDGRPPFVRKEPNYAYQTTDSVTEFSPKIDGKVPYPDPVTGNTVMLNWLSSEHASDIGVGTPYREFLSRENTSKEPSESVCVTEKDRLAAFAEFDFQRVVRAALDMPDNSLEQNKVTKTKKTTIDEPFDEIVPVEKMPIFADKLPSALPASLSFLHDNPLPQQIVDAVNRITEAAEKIEQAAKRSEDAGQQIKRAADFVDAEVNAALPSYMDLFRELSEFHQTVSAELNGSLTKHCGHAAKFIPFTIRASFSTITPTPLPSESGDEKSIDFKRLFQ